MNSRLKRVHKEFNLTIMTLAATSVLLLGFILYETNSISFSRDISSKDLQEVVEDHPEVKEYLETEHQNEAHFVTIANIIKNDQQQQLGSVMLLATLPVVILATAIGSLLAKRLLRPVEEAYDAQERFIADAAHELRNPLATMSALVQHSDEAKSMTKEKFTKYNTSLKRQLKRMVRINEDLLYLERDFESETDTPINVSELLMDVLEDLQPAANQANLKFKLSIEEGIMNQMTSREFVRMSKNIIENAIKYSRDSSKTVAITLAKSKNGTQLVVKDSGIGIPKKDQANISERFFRASNANAHDGTGLGLAIVKKILDYYGGSLTILSESSKGTTVIARF